MKLRKLARQLAAAAVAGAMALSFCMPALAETWDMSNTEKYPNGKGSWISVTRYADIDDHPELNGQFLEIWNSSDKPDPIKEKDEAPVLSGSFETLDLNGYDGTTVYATLQDAHIEYNADSSPTLTTSGNVELTLSGNNTVKHTYDTRTAIDIDDDGTIHIASPDAASCDAAKKMIDDICFVPEVGKLYYGKVVRILPIGAFVELAPGKDGMIHISKLENRRVEKVEDVLNIGDMTWVKVTEIDEKGRVNLSRKDALKELAAAADKK